MCSFSTFQVVCFQFQLNHEAEQCKYRRVKPTDQLLWFTDFASIQFHTFCSYHFGNISILFWHNCRQVIPLSDFAVNEFGSKLSCDTDVVWCFATGCISADCWGLLPRGWKVSWPALPTRKGMRFDAVCIMLYIMLYLFVAVAQVLVGGLMFYSALKIE